MAYPDFAFYTSTQIILFFVNCTVTILAHYWGTNIILQIHHKNVSFKQKFLFSVITAILLNILVVYGFACFYGFSRHMGKLHLGELYNLIRVMNPFSYILFYLLGIYILKLPNYKSIKIMQLIYVYFICRSLILEIFGLQCFPKISDPRGYNYLRDMFMLLSGVLLTYIFYRLARYFVNRCKLYLDFPDNIIVKSIGRELGKNLSICTVIYALTVSFLYYPQKDIIHYIFLIIILLGYILVSITYDYNKIYQEKLVNKDEHITALNQSIEEFSGIKHDFNNILQTYGGYLAINDLEKLEKYHNKVTHTTLSAGTNMDISQRMPENPPFFSLIMNKLEKAKKSEITLQTALCCNMTEIYIDSLDFIRIMGILLDNAIEAAEQGPLKRVSLTGQMKSDQSKLFIVSNDILGNVNTQNLFVSGFTTKPGHTGQGLPQVRNILHKYGNSTFNVTCYKGNFTVYLELKPNAF